MAVVTPVWTYVPPNNTTQTGATYKGNIDGAFNVGYRVFGPFAPHAQSVPNMTVRLDAGYVFDGVTLSEIAAQNSSAITAPGSNSRIDRIVIDAKTGAVSVITGTPAVSPTPPAITNGKLPIAQVLLTSLSTSITNSMISDERALGGGAVGGFGPMTTIASAGTTDIGTVASRFASITGTNTITALGSSASVNLPMYLVQFAGALTLTHNATSLIIQGGQNIKTAAGDYALLQYLGSGNWRVVQYFAADGQPVSAFGALSTLASAGTCDLGTAGTNYINITGTSGITALGSTATIANQFYVTRFSGILTLTHNASSLILLGSANITTAAGDVAYWEYLGSGNWRMVGYTRATGAPLTGGDFKLVLSGTFSAVASVNINFNGLLTGYSNVKVMVDSVIPSTDATITAQVMNNNTPVTSGNYNWAVRRDQTQGSTGTDSGTNDTSFTIGAIHSNSPGYSGTFEVEWPINQVRDEWIAEYRAMLYMNSTFGGSYKGGVYNFANSLDADGIKFLMSTGTFTGRYRVYAMA